MIASLLLILTSCTIDWNGVGKSFEDLIGEVEDIVSNDETTITDATPSSIVVESLPETPTPTIIPTDIPTPTATPSPTATPVPSLPPERVDYSDLTSLELAESIELLEEEFQESYVMGDDTLVSFQGSRVLLHFEEAPNVEMAVNLYLDGFYQESLGMYNRLISEAKAFCELAPEDQEYPGSTLSVNYEYYSNGRLLSVFMSYSSTSGEEITFYHEEYVAFDLYTGAVISSSQIINDETSFNTTAYDAYLSSFSSSEEEETLSVSEDQIKDIYVVPSDRQRDFAELKVFFCIEDGEKVFFYMPYADFEDEFTRYGSYLYNIVVEEE